MTPLEQALVALAEAQRYLFVAISIALPMLVISIVLMFIVVWQVLHIRSDTSYLRHKSDESSQA